MINLWIVDRWSGNTSRTVRYGALALLLAAGCGGSSASVDAQTGTGADASTADAPTADATAAAIDAAAAADAAAGDAAVADAGSTFSGLGDMSKWVTDHSSPAAGSLGAAFDGRYLYLAPNRDGNVGRFDTQATFTDAASWTAFDTTTVGGTKGDFGAVFDGRYVYFVPSFDGTNYDGLMVRYDTHGSFTDAAAWTLFDISTVDSNAVGFRGAAFDGRYLYLVPYANASGGSSGLVTRYDTHSPFADVASWSKFDLAASFNASMSGFRGALFDGKYLYLVPSDGSMVAQYDTTATFASTSSWHFFDTTTLDSGAKGYFGAGFDGRYLYLVPNNNGSSDGLVVRYDTTLGFTSQGSWASFDVASNVDPAAEGFAGAVFDGRYLYLVPHFNTTSDAVVAQYDTQASFAAKASWATFDAKTVDTGAGGFAGGVFDGRYVYFVPNGNGVVARFDDRNPAVALPHLCASAAALYCYAGSFL